MKFVNVDDKQLQTLVLKLLGLTYLSNKVLHKTKNFGILQ